MFEGFVYQLLAGYLGHYVKDIQREQLRIGLWSGVALLENVEIRLEAFDYLQLPFAIQSGTIGKLRLQVPWKRLGWDPIIVALEDVVLISGPREDAEWEAGPAEKRALASKKAKLAAAGIRKLSERVSEDKSGQSFMSYLSAKIIDNVQVAVKNIHVKYEDLQTHPEGPFSFGIVLSGLNLRSAEGWQLSTPASSPSASAKKKGASNFVHKLIEVDGLGVYWNSQGDLHERRRRRSAREQPPAEAELPLEEYAYLMRPVDVKIKLAIHKSAVLDKSTPQHSVSVDVEGLSFALEELQFQEMLLLLDAMSIYELREKYGKYRPRTEHIARSPVRRGKWQRAWWQYAINAVRSDIHAKIYRPTWRYLSWRRDMRKRYVAIYKKKLDRVRHGQAPDAADSAQLEKMEEELDVEDITFFRSWAEGQMNVEAAALSRRECVDSPGAEHTREQQGWLSWVSWGLLGAGGSSIDAGGFTGAISDKDLKELYKAMDFYPSLYAEDSAWPKEYCHTSLVLTVQEALFSLRSSYSKRDIMKASLQAADVNVRLRRDSTSVSLTLGSLEAEDLCSPGSTFSRIVCPKNSTAPIPLDSADVSSILKLNRSHSYTVESPTGSWANLTKLNDEQTLPLLRIECDLHPEELNVDVRFLVAIQPLEVVYSPAFIKRAAMFFNHPASIQTHQELVVSALNGLENLRARTISKAEYVFSTRMRTSFQINVHAPLLIIPEAGQEKGSTLLVVDFGLLQLTSGLQPQSGATFSGGSSNDALGSQQRMTGPGLGPWSQEELRDMEPGMKRSASFPGAQRLDSLPRSNPDVQTSILKEITDSALYDRFHFEVKDLQVAVARQSSDWRAILEQDGWDARVHLVNRSDLKLMIDSSSLPSDTTITKTKILGNLPTVYFHLSVCKLQSLRAVLNSLARSEVHPTSNLASSILYTTSPAPSSFSPFTPTPPPAQWALSPYELPPESKDSEQEDNAHNASFVALKGGVKEVEDLGQHAPLVELRLCVEAAAVEVSLGDTLVQQGLMGGAFLDGKVVLQLGNACIGFKLLPLQTTMDLTLSSCHIEDFSKPLHSAQRFLLQPSNPQTPEPPESPVASPLESSTVLSLHFTSVEETNKASVSEFNVQMADFVLQCNRATLAAISAFAQAAGNVDTSPPTAQKSNTSHASSGEEALNPNSRNSVDASSLRFATPVKSSPLAGQSLLSIAPPEVTAVKLSVVGSIAIKRLEIHFNTAEETMGVITAVGADISVNLETLGEDGRWLTEGSFGHLVLDAPIEGRGQMRLWDAVTDAGDCRNRFVVGTLGLEGLRHPVAGTAFGGRESVEPTGGSILPENLAAKMGEAGREDASLALGSLAGFQAKQERTPPESKSRAEKLLGKSLDCERGVPATATGFAGKAFSESPKRTEEGTSANFAAKTSSEYTSRFDKVSIPVEGLPASKSPEGLKIFIDIKQVHAILFGTFITKATAYFTHEEWFSGHIFADDTPTLSGLSEDIVLSMPESESQPESTVVYEFSITDCVLDLPSTLEEPQSRTFPQVALPQLTVCFSLLGDTWAAQNQEQLSMFLSVEGRGLSLATWHSDGEMGAAEKGGWEGSPDGGGRGEGEKVICRVVEGLDASLGMKWFKQTGAEGTPATQIDFDSPGLQVNLTSSDVATLSAILDNNLLRMDFISACSDEAPRPPSPTGRPSHEALSRATFGSGEALFSAGEPGHVPVKRSKSIVDKALSGDQESGDGESLQNDAYDAREVFCPDSGSRNEAPMRIHAGLGLLLVSFSGEANPRQLSRRSAALIRLQTLGLAADVREESGSLQLTWHDVSIGHGSPRAEPGAGSQSGDTWLEDGGALLLQLRASGEKEGVRFSWGDLEKGSLDFRVVSMDAASPVAHSGRSLMDRRSPSIEGTIAQIKVGLPETLLWLLVEHWAASVAAVTACLQPAGDKGVGLDGGSREMGDSKRGSEGDLNDGDREKSGATSRLTVNVNAPVLKLILPSAPIKNEWKEGGLEESEETRFEGLGNHGSEYDSDSEPDEIANSRNPRTPLYTQFSGQFTAQNSWQATAQKRPVHTSRKSCVLTLDVNARAQQGGDTWQVKTAVEQALLTAETRQKDKLAASLPLLRIATLRTTASMSLPASVNKAPDEVKVESLQNGIKFDADVTLGAMESWCSFPILRFFRDFGVDLGGVAADNEALPFRGQLRGRLGRASFLLSDCRWYNNAPILELLLSEVRLHGQTGVRISSLLVTADVVANYHNIEKVAWEPLLEPYSFTLELEQSANEAATGKVESEVRVQVASAAILNVNITEGLVKAAMRASEVVKEGLEYSYDDDGSHVGSFEEGHTGAAHKRRYAPSWLKNETGVTMRYWLSSSAAVTATVTASGMLLPGKSAPIYVEEDLINGQGLGLNQFGHVQHRMIQVQLEGSGVRSPRMSIDQVGGHTFPVTFTPSQGSREDRLARQSSAFPMTSSITRGRTRLGRQASEFPMTSSGADDDIRVAGRVISGLSLERTASGTPSVVNGQFRTQVVCDVQLRRYSKMVVLKSMVALTNKTSVPLDLCFEMPFALEGKVLGPIHPGQTFPFPSHQAGGSGRVRWRPSGDTHFWSEAQALSNLLKAPETRHNTAESRSTRPHRSIVCAPNRPQGKPFRFCMDVASSELATVSNLETVSSRGRKRAGRVLGSQSEEGGKTWRMWEINLLPPVVIDNWLPCAVVVTLKAGGATLAEETSIAQGQSAHIFEADSHQELRLTFQPAGFGVTSVVKVPRVLPNAPETDGLESLTSMEVLELTAQHSGAKITIELETTVSLISGTRRLFLSCGYWLFNCTDLQLVFQEADASRSRSNTTGEQSLPPPPKSTLPGSLFRNPGGLGGPIRPPTKADEPFERKRSWPDAAGLEAALTSIPESHSIQGGRGSDCGSVRSSVNAPGVEPLTPSLSRQSSLALSSYFGAPSSGGTVIRQGSNASASILPPGSQQGPKTPFHTPLKTRSRLGRQDSFTPAGMREGSEYSFGGVDTPASSRPGSPFSYTSYASTPRSVRGNGSFYGNGSNYATRSLRGARSLYGLSSGSDLQAVMYGRPTRVDSDEPQLRIRVMKPAQRGIGTGHVAASEWSKPFGLDPAGGVSVLYIPRWKKGGLYVLAVSSIPAVGECVSRTKTVTVRPRYVLVNALQRDLIYKQQGTESYQHLAAGQHRPFHWTDVKRNFRVCLRFDENGWDWSGGFAPDQLGDILLKMRQQSNRSITMVRVDVSCPDPPESDGKMARGGSRGVGTCVVVISEDKGGFEPYRIENFSTETVRFHQERCEEADDVLRPYSSCAYAWDEPCRPHRLIMTVPGAGKLGTFSLDKVWQYPRLHLAATTQRPERTLQVSVQADGPTRVISVSDVSMHQWEEPEGSGPGSSKAERTGEATGPTDMTLELTLKLAGVGVSVVDSTPQELLYGCTRGLHVRLVRGTHEQMAEFHVASLQLDNQLRHATYPVLLSTSEPETTTLREDLEQTSGSREKVVALSGRVMHWRRQTGSVDCFRLVALRVAPLRLEIEERLVARIVEFASAIQADSRSPKPSSLARPMDESESGSWPDFTTPFTPSLIHTSGPGSVASGASTGHSEGVHTGALGGLSTVGLTGPSEGVHTGALGGLSSVVLTGHSEGGTRGPQPAAVAFVGGPGWDVWTLVKDRRKVYIETLHIHSIDLTISFVSAPWLPWEIRGAAARGMLTGAGIAIQRRVMALADLEDAPVHLGPLKLEHPLASYGTLWGMVSRHYTRQVLQGVYKVLGSADFLGNPVGFFQSVGSGLWDFVTTPAASLVQSPREFTSGVAQGTRSLFSNTVFAFSNAATRLSGAARKGVQTWVLDREYIEEMERRRREENGGDGGVLRAILEGLTGVLEQPVRGAESSGLAGMVTGTAKGLVGLVAKPTASVLELASRTTQSIRNATRRSSSRATRVRPPRQISADAPLTKYLREEAVGRAVLLEAEGGWYRNEAFSQCFPLSEPGEFLVLSETRVLSVESASYRPAAKTPEHGSLGREWTIQWEIAFKDVLHVQAQGRGLRILAMSPTLTSKPTKPSMKGTPPKATGAAPYVHKEIRFEEEGAAEYLRKHLSEHANRSSSSGFLEKGSF